MPGPFSGARPSVYAGAFASSRQPSGTIWHDLPADITLPGRGRGFFDDFILFPSAIATATYYGPGYYHFLDTSNTVTALATSPQGHIVIAADATDNDSPVIQMPFGAGFIVFNTRANGGTRIWFEARVKVSSITDCSLFVGLMEEASAADNWMTDDDGIMVDKDHVGFHSLTATPSELDVAYTLAGQTDGETGNVHTLVADTWMKLGMKYDPSRGSEGRLTFFVDGSEEVSARIEDIDASNFPDTEEMSPVLGIKNGTAAARSMTVDWIGCYQEELTT